MRRLRGGADVSPTAYISGYREMLRLRRTALELFEQVDLILTPTSPVSAASIAELESAPDQLRRKELHMLRNTRPFNVLGLPAISIPCGFTRAGLPVGLQIIGAPGAEGVVMALARAYEKQTEWHKRRPEDL